MTEGGGRQGWGSAGHQALGVRGGVGGTAAGLDDLDAAARRLGDCAARLVPIGPRLIALAADPVAVVTAPLSPVTAALAARAVAAAAGPSGLAGEVVLVAGLAAATSGAAAAYRAAEAAAVAGAQAARDTLMGLVGRCLPEVAVGVLALDALGVDVAAGLDRFVATHPGVVDLAGGVGGLVAGARADPRVGWLLVPGLLAPTSGGRPDSYELGVGVLAGAARAWGLLRDDGVAVVTEEVRPRAGSDPPAAFATVAGAPRGLGDLAHDLVVVGDGRDYPGHVRVVQVPGPQGSAWVVEVSGTQDWDPRAGAEVLDVTSDVQLMAGAASVLGEAVEEALDQAQAEAGGAGGSGGSGGSGAGDPVMLVGHSLGGITAAALAASPAFTARHRVTHVVTMGSPVARVPVPESVSVLSLEHQQDPVPRLEGRANPDRSGWVTVERSAALAPGSGGSAAHAVEQYVGTAALTDLAADPSVDAWRRGSAAFFEGDRYGAAVVRDYRVGRAPG
jgi:PGAP1-like protein